MFIKPDACCALKTGCTLCIKIDARCASLRRMNILIDIAHPAHVHLVRNTYFELVQRRHRVYVTVREIPSAIALLEKYEIPYLKLGGKKRFI